MSSHDVTLTDESGVAELERTSGTGRWLVLGAVLFAVAFLLGWRSVGSRKRREQAVSAASRGLGDLGDWNTDRGELPSS